MARAARTGFFIVIIEDPLGLPVEVADVASVSAVDDFVGGFIACEARIVNILAAAERDSTLYVQAAAAAVHLFSEAPEGVPNARRLLAAARQTGSERERLFASAVEAWADGATDLAMRRLEALLAIAPRDLAALKLAHYLLFNTGDSPAMLRLSLASQAAAADSPYLHGMTAFAWEQCHFLDEAERAAERALAIEKREPWAQHAMAHVMLTDGRFDSGQAFLESASAGWQGLNSFMQTHNWWHLALFMIERGDLSGALALYDQQVWGVCKPYSQDQIGAVSLLARLELAGLDVGERWADVGTYLAARTNDQVLPFLDMQYLYGLARAERPQADVLMRNVEAHAERVHGSSRSVWRRVALPACRGLLAHARGDMATAVEQLGRALPRLIEIGGSHAQRDLFEQIYLDSLIRSGRCVAAQQWLQPKAHAHPQSWRLAHLLRPVHSALGLPALQALS